MLFECNVGDKYEWIKGENFGTEEVVRLPSVQDGSMILIEFVSGRRCNKQIAREYLSLIGTAADLGIVNPEEFAESLATKQNNNKVHVSGLVTNNLYKDILDKIKSYEDQTLDFSINISLPKKQALNILIDAYGDELSSELATYISNKITNDVKDQIELKVDEWINLLSK